MTENPLLKMLLFFNSKKLNQFKRIKKIIFYQHTLYSLSGLRMIMTKFMSYKEIKNHCMYSRYREEIDINYLTTESGKELLKKLSKFNYEKDDSLCFINNDLDIDFISFCNFNQLQTLDLDNTQITDNAIEHLTKCNFNQLKELNLAYTQTILIYYH